MAKSVNSAIKRFHLKEKINNLPPTHTHISLSIKINK